MYNKEVDFTEEEKIGAEDLKTFCSYFPKHFAKLYTTAYGTFCDAVCENITGGTNILETKHRYDGSQYNYIFIEPKKYKNLMEMYDKGLTPFYINTFEDSKYFYMWVLPQIPEDSIKKYKNVKIKNRDGSYKTEDRFGLPKNMAWILKPDGSIIKPKNQKRIPPPVHLDIDYNKPITNQVLRNE